MTNLRFPTPCSSQKDCSGFRLVVSIDDRLGKSQTLSYKQTMLHRTATSTRRTGGGALLLPSGGASQQRQRREIGGNSGTSPAGGGAGQLQRTTVVVLLLLTGMALGGLLGLVTLHLSGHGVNSSPLQREGEADALQLTPEERHRRLTDSDFYVQFPSLQSILRDYDIVALYFAAAWCPMSTAVTELLHDSFGATMMNMNMDTDKAVAATADGPTTTTTTNPLSFALVYISSDESKAQFDQYRKKWWQYVPYENVIERQQMKQFLRTCAKREMEHLNITAPRDAEIPHLDILRYGQLLTREGIRDVRERGSTAISYWQTATPHDLHVTMGQ
jgi:hypothetical protein